MVIQKFERSTQEIPLYAMGDGETCEKETLNINNLDKATVCVIGLGYVGLPLVEAFVRSLKVIGFDVKSDKVAALKRKYEGDNLIFTDNAREIAKADFIILCVPTPVTKSKEPDLSYVIGAATTAGQNMKNG